MFGTSRLVSLILAFCLGFSVAFGAIAFGTMAAISKFKVRDIEKFGINIPDENFMTENPEVDLLNLSLVDFIKEAQYVSSLGDDATINNLQERYGLLIHEKIDAVLNDDMRNMPIRQLMSKDGFSQILSGIYIGNIEGYSCFNADGSEDGNPDDEDSYWMTKDSVKITGIEDIIADFSLNDFIDGNINTNTLFDEITIGDILGYTQDGENWVNKEGNKVTGVIAAFAGSTIHSVGTDIDNVMIGEILGYEKNDSDEWCKKNEETGELEKVTGVMAVFADSKINEIGDEIENAQLGELLGYEKKEDGSWYKTNSESGESEKVTGVMAVFADSDINGIGDRIETAELGELLGYEKKEDGSWYKTNSESGESEKVTGVMAVFADSNINGIGDEIETAKLGELLGYQLVEGVWHKDDGTGNLVKVTGAMSVFADSNINGIGDEIEQAKIGKLLGYEEENGVWYKSGELDENGNKIAVDGFMSKISNSTINNMDGVFDTLEIGDIVSAESRTGIFAIIDPDTKINNIGGAVNDSIMESPIQFFINEGLITFSTSDGNDMSDTLDTISFAKNDYTYIYTDTEDFANQQSYYEDVWTLTTDANGVDCYKVETWRTQQLSSSFAYIISLITSY